jgi:hypothetical protein
MYGVSRLWTGRRRAGSKGPAYLGSCEPELRLSPNPGPLSPPYCAGGGSIWITASTIWG